MGTIHIWHHGDTDGINAGASIFHLINIDGYTEKQCHRINNYAEILDLSIVKEDDLVFFVDYSFTNINNINEVEKLIDRLYNTREEVSKHVFWFDHHGSSRKYSNEYPLNCTTQIINTDVCGTVISFLVGSNFNLHNNDSIDSLLEAIEKTKIILEAKDYESYCNEYILYVDSWDCWKHNRIMDEEFNLGNMSMFQNPESEIFYQILMKNTAGDRIIEQCIEKGKIVKAFQTAVNSAQLAEMSYEFTLGEYSCIMYNGRGNSCTFGDLIDKYDICSMFYFDGENYLYSLYSKKVNVAEIAEKFGGGGHVGASGFQSKKLLFTKGTSYKL